MNKDYFIKIGLTEEGAEKALFLYTIVKSISSKNLVLKGGTSLLLGYELNRLSTDLDFNTNMKKNEDIKNNIFKILKENNIRYSAIHKKEIGSRVIYDILFRNKKTNDKLKIDIDYSGKYLNDDKNVVFKNGIYLFSPDIICKMKYDALLSRKKARDIFDIEFLLQNYGSCFENEMLLNIKNRIEEIGQDKIILLFKRDEVLNVVDTENIIKRMYENVKIRNTAIRKG